MKKFFVLVFVCLLNGCVLGGPPIPDTIFCLSGGEYVNSSHCWQNEFFCDRQIEPCEQQTNSECICEIHYEMFCTEFSHGMTCYSSMEICQTHTETGICERIGL